MLTVNLEQKLIESKKKTLKKFKSNELKGDLLLDQVKNILENSSKEDIEELKSRGFSNAIINANEKNKEKIFLRNIIDKINNNERIFTKSEIKDVAVSYGLRFLDIHYYEGSVPSDILLSMKKVEKENDVNHPSYYILAPKESFNLQVKPKDPLLFLLLKDNTYYLVKKWGNDLSVGRWLSNLFVRNSITLNISRVLLLCLLIVGLVYGIGLNIQDGVKWYEVIIPVYFALSIVFLLTSCVIGNEGEYEDVKWVKKFNPLLYLCTRDSNSFTYDSPYK